MNGYRKFLRRRPIFVLIASVFLSLFFIWQLFSLKIDPSNESMLPRNDPAYGYLKEFRERFGEDEFIVMTFRLHQGQPSKSIGQIEETAQKVREFTHVRLVQSPLRPSGNELLPLPIDEAREVLSANPTYAEVLASKDLRTFALLIWIEQVDGDRSYRSSVVEKIRLLASKTRSASLEIYVAGSPVEKNDISAYVRGDQALIVPLVFLFFAAILYSIYRNGLLMLLSLGLVGTGLIWTLGFYVWLGHELNTVTGLLSPLIMIVTLGNAIHFLNHYVKEIASGSTPNIAMDAALDGVLVPCFLAAITTAGGLLTIATLGVPAVQIFGLFAAAGVLFSFGLSMSAFPTLVHYLVQKIPSEVPQSHTLIERSLSLANRLTADRPKTVLYIALVSTALALTGLPRLVVDTDIIRSLRPSAPLRQATEFIDREMSGVTSLEMIVSRNGGKSLLEGKSLEKIAHFEDYLERQPEITKAISIVDALSYTLEGARDRQPRKVPSDEAEIDSFRKMIEGTPLIMKQARSWTDKSFSHFRISARMNSIGSQAVARLHRRIQDYVTQNWRDSLEVKMTGNHLLLSNMSNQLVSRQIQSLGIATVFVLLIIGLLFRSFRVMLLAAVPNILPIGMAFGLMGWTGIPLSVPTAMISSISLGLIVDNTIHFLYGFRKRRGDGQPWDTAVGNTL